MLAMILFLNDALALQDQHSRAGQEAHDHPQQSGIAGSGDRCQRHVFIRDKLLIFLQVTIVYHLEGELRVGGIGDDHVTAAGIAATGVVGIDRTGQDNVVLQRKAGVFKAIVGQHTIQQHINLNVHTPGLGKIVICQAFKIRIGILPQLIVRSVIQQVRKRGRVRGRLDVRILIRDSIAEAIDKAVLVAVYQLCIRTAGLLNLNHLVIVLIPSASVEKLVLALAVFRF